jgi:WhiB family redox-sensing transcriptional regulator
MQAGACRDVADPDIFFAEDGRKLSDKLSVMEARRVCTQECQFQERCLDYSINAGIDHGIWGGHTPEERIMIRRQRAAVAQLTTVE